MFRNHPIGPKRWTKIEPGPCIWKNVNAKVARSVTLPALKNEIALFPLQYGDGLIKIMLKLFQLWKGKWSFSSVLFTDCTWLYTVSQKCVTADWERLNGDTGYKYLRF